MFGSRLEFEALPFSSGGGSETLPRRLFLYTFADFDFQKPNEVASTGFDGALHWLRRGFSGSNWKLAAFPKTMKSWLDSNPPPDAPDFGLNEPCKQVKQKYDAQGRRIVNTK